MITPYQSWLMGRLSYAIEFSSCNCFITWQNTTINRKHLFSCSHIYTLPRSANPLGWQHSAWCSWEFYLAWKFSSSHQYFQRTLKRDCITHTEGKAPSPNRNDAREIRPKATWQATLIQWIITNSAFAPHVASGLENGSKSTTHSYMSQPSTNCWLSGIRKDFFDSRAGTKSSQARPRLWISTRKESTTQSCLKCINHTRIRDWCVRDEHKQFPPINRLVGAGWEQYATDLCLDIGDALWWTASSVFPTMEVDPSKVEDHVYSSLKNRTLDRG